MIIDKDFKRIKNRIIVNLSYMNLVIKSLDIIDDKRLTSNKLNKKTWLKRLY
jgi:hypothetical protein